MKFKIFFVTMLRRMLVLFYLSSVMGLDFCDDNEKSCALTKRPTRSGECEYEYNATASMGSLVPLMKNKKCKNQLVTFSEALRNSSLWAVQMMDASAKILQGEYQLGHFDECVDTNLDNVHGKYCLTDVEFEKKVRRIGSCIPDECGEAEIGIILRRYYPQIPEGIKITGSSCVTNKIRSENPAARYLRHTVLGLSLWVGLVTIIDLLTPERKELNEFWEKTSEIFSCYRSILRLTTVSDRETFVGLHFLKVMTVAMLVFCRRYKVLEEGPVKNRLYFEKEGLISSNQILDLLIFQSGFLAVQKLSEIKDVGRRGRCFLQCATRWLRSAPLYVAAVAFYAFALEEIGNGPLWVEKTGAEAGRCRESWWANLSFINNYISASRQCIAQSWYFAVTAHCSLLTLIFMHLKSRKSFVGLGSFGVLLATTTALFVWNDLDLAKKQLKPNEQEEFVRDFYMKTHNRATPYTAGAISAFVYNYVKNPGNSTPRARVLVVSFAFGTFGLIAVLHSSLSEKLDIESKLLHSITESLSWSLFIAIILISSSLYEPNIFKMMQNIFVPVSRLSYPILLVHNVVQVYMVATARVPEYVTFPRLVLMGSADLFSSYLLALVLYLVIQAPATSLINVIFQNKEEKISQTGEKDESRY